MKALRPKANASSKALSRERFLLLGAGLSGVVGRKIGASASVMDSVPVRVAVDPSRKQGCVPPRIAGLSYEKSKLSTQFFTPANTDLISCFKRLGPSVLRIGGNTVDRTTWNPIGSGATLGEVAPRDLEAAADFLRLSGWQVIYGINLGSNSPAAAAAEAEYAAKLFGENLSCFEIGNECDAYCKNGVRPETYNVTDFMDEWSKYASAIRRSVPDAQLGGPGSAANLSSWTLPFVSTESKMLQLITQHYYRADGRSSTSTMPLLMKENSHLIGALNQLKRSATANRIVGGYRLSEANSFFDGGAPNVSDAHGSALWAIDLLLGSAQCGSAGVNFHGGGSGFHNPPYTPIADINNNVIGLRPVFYGMLFIAQIAPGVMYGVDLDSALNLSAYAVFGHDRAMYVAIVNKEPAIIANTEIEFGIPASHATALILAGSSLDALTGTTLGGAMIEKDGSWSPIAARRFDINGESLKLDVRPASATLLKLTLL